MNTNAHCAGKKAHGVQNLAEVRGTRRLVIVVFFRIAHFLLFFKLFLYYF